MNKKRVMIIGGILIALCLTLLVAFNFNNKDLSPSETITAFHESAKSGEIEETKQYVSSDILNGFEKGQFWVYGTYTGFINDYNKKTKSLKVLPKTEKINGQTASVDVKIKDKYSEYVDTYSLIKEDGIWKIAE